MRISDWSSDVCSSDLPFVLAFLSLLGRIGELVESIGHDQTAVRGELTAVGTKIVDRLFAWSWPAPSPLNEVAFAANAFYRTVYRRHVRALVAVESLKRGKASCRERVCQYV